MLSNSFWEGCVLFGIFKYSSKDILCNSISVESLLKLICKASVVELEREEIELFCKQAEYESRYVEKGFVPSTEEDRLYLSPPPKNIDTTNWNLEDSLDSKKDLECILGQQETDQMSFSESFKYHRECNGKGSLFSWNGSEYSTLLASEVIPQKTPVAEKPVKSIDKHHLALQQEILGTTVGSK